MPYDTFIRSQASEAPDDKRLIIEGTIEDKLAAALDKWLQLGAVVTKPATRRGVASLQYKPGQPGQPGSTLPFMPAQTLDVTGEQARNGPYIVTINAEGQNVRYTTSGKQPGVGFGMLVQVGQFVDISLSDVNELAVCAVAAGATINVELSTIDA